MQIQTWEGQVQGLRYRGGSVGTSSELSLWCSISASGCVVLVCRYSGALIHVRQSRRWRDLSAVLEGDFIVQFCQIISTYSLFILFFYETPTRQTTVPHRRHSPTISLAHVPTLPLVILGILIPAGPCVVHKSSSSSLNTLSGFHAGRISDTHRKVCGISCLRC